MRLRFELVITLGLATGCETKMSGADSNTESGAPTESDSDSGGEVVEDLPASDELGSWTVLLESDTPAPAQDKGLDIVVTPDGDYVIVGSYASRGFMAKISAMGEELWMSLPDQVDSSQFGEVEVDELGNIYVLANRPGPGLDDFAHIVKFDADGVYQWDVDPPYFYWVTCLSVNGDGIYIAGTGQGPFDEALPYHEHYSLEGTLNWNALDDYGECKDAQSTPGAIIQATDDYKIIRMQADGGMDWTIDLLENGKPLGVAVDADGTIAVVGNYLVNGANSENGRIWLFDANGESLWTRDIDGSAPNMKVRASDVAFTVDGDLLVVGDRGNRYALLSRWSRAGELAWLEPMATVEDKLDHAAVGVVVRDADNAALVGWWPAEAPEDGQDQAWAHGFTP